MIIKCDALLFWKELNICLLMENSEWIPYFTLIVHAASNLPFKLSVFQSIFSLLTVRFSPCSTTGWNEQMAVWSLARVNPWHLVADSYCQWPESATDAPGEPTAEKLFLHALWRSGRKNTMVKPMSYKTGNRMLLSRNCRQGGVREKQHNKYINTIDIHWLFPFPQVL